MNAALKRTENGWAGLFICLVLAATAFEPPAYSFQRHPSIREPSVWPKDHRSLREEQTQLAPKEPTPLSVGQVGRRMITDRGTAVVELQVLPVLGEVIYRNAPGAVVYPLSPMERIADDLMTNCATSQLTSIEVRVYGFGDGSGPGFDITIELFDGCPSDGGSPIEGTLASVELPDDGLFDVVVNFEESPIPIGQSVWLAMSTSSSIAGWVFGGQPDVGESNDLVDGTFPCNTSFGGCPPSGPACANGAATLRGIDCMPAFVAYRADSPSAYFLHMEPQELIADDILPLTAPGLCDLVGYAPSVAGDNGPYCMTYEIWADDPEESAPAAPVMGTQRTCCSESPECDLTFSPPITIPTPRFWFAYDVSGNTAGPVMVNIFPSIGFSDDCFAIMPTDGPCMVNCGCQWHFGGCPPFGNNPCGTFHNMIRCAALEPIGACCVPDSPDGTPCHDDVPISKCTGSFAIHASCEDEPFEPPCPPSTYCPPGAVTFVNPPLGVVDARRPVAPSAQQTYLVEAPSGVNPICWSACNTGGGAPSIAEYEEVSPGVFSITLSNPLVAGTVTELTYTDANGQRTTGRFTAHPGNVNGDTYAGPTDILALIDCLNGVNPAVNCPWGLYSTDIDRSGAANAADILALINVLNGASCGDEACPWGPTLPGGSCTP